MASYSNIYPGGDYGLDAERTLNYGEYVPASHIALTTSAQTANQLKEVFDKLRSGAKAIEIGGISPEIMESIPQQHLQEINRLKKLAGAELTLHGPIIEASGVTKQGWEESAKQEAERQIWSAVQRSHALEPDGNIIVNLHTTAALPEMKTRVIETVDGKKQEVIKEMWVVDDEGKFASIIPKEKLLVGEPKDIEKQLITQNEEFWSKNLGHISFGVTTASDHINRSISSWSNFMKPSEKEALSEEDKKSLKETDLFQIYNKLKTPEGQKIYKDLSEKAKEKITDVLGDFNFGYIYIKDAYNELEGLFRRAVKRAKEEGNNKDYNALKSFAEEFTEKEKKEKITQNPEKVKEFSDMVTRGTALLGSISTPKVFKPLNEFVIDKSSDTFSDVAFKSFKEFGKSAPIISLENPPAGGGLSRTEDMAALVNASRKKFEEKAIKELHLSKSEAKEQAEKLIGATLDVGHMNMLRKYGYEEEHLIEEARKLKPIIKHIHLSDNFGFEHTELPMGMGNVPTQKILKELGEKAVKAKKVVEAINWYQYFQSSPLKETFEHLGSPIYQMGMKPVWRATGVTGEYFAGRGLYPEVHYATFGAGFSGLPSELGGQVGGGRKSISGAPI